MKKTLYIILIILGITTLSYSIYKYISIYNNFWKHEMLFINENLDTILIVMCFYSILIIVYGVIALYKTIKGIKGENT